ncbi:unnamed protein product, partial [Phaeothamnion confervicola]
MVYVRPGHDLEAVFRQFNRMFSALYDARNTYVVHVDIKSDKRLQELIEERFKDLPNAFLIESASASWAGITVVERTLALMQAALEADGDGGDNGSGGGGGGKDCGNGDHSGGRHGGGGGGWRYFVNIGHEDYPLVPQAAASARLAAFPDGTNFIKCWNIEGHDFFGQWEHHKTRVHAVYVDDFTGTTHDTRFRRPSMSDPSRSPYKFFKSLQQTVLSRNFVRHAVRSAAARRLLVYMATAQAPDELFFPTLLQLDPKFAATC